MKYFLGKRFLWLPVHVCLSRCDMMGHGGVLVESMPFLRRIVGSNPALAATYRPWASPSLTVACIASGVNSDTVSIAVVGSASERLML